MTLSDESVGEPSLDPPHEPNPITVDPQKASYEVLLAHMDDARVMGTEPTGLSRGVAVILLRALYAVCDTKGIALTSDEEQDYRDGRLQIEESYG